MNSFTSLITTYVVYTHGVPGTVRVRGNLAVVVVLKLFPTLHYYYYYYGNNILEKNLSSRPFTACTDLNW